MPALELCECEVMTQDQIILMLDLKASLDRGASSMGAGQRVSIVDGLVRLKMIERHGAFGGYRITPTGIKYLEKRKEKVK